MRGPRIAVSAEAYGDYHKKGDFKPIVHVKTEEQKTKIKSRIVQSFLFESLEANELRIVIDAMEEEKFNTGEVVINQGDKGDCLYIVESGELECLKRSSNESDFKLVKVYTAGEAFGELALLYNCPRAARVVTKTSVVLWKLDRETFNNIVKESAIKKRQKYENFLRRVELLSTVESYELTQISDALKFAYYAPGDYIIKEVFVILIRMNLGISSI